MHSIIYHIHMRPLDLLTYSSIIYLIFKIDFWSLEICIPIAVIYKFVQAIRHFFCNGIKVRGICQTGHSGKPRRFQLSIHHGIEVEVVVPRLCFDFITSATQITKSGDGVPLKEAFDQLLHITYKYIRQLQTVNHFTMMKELLDVKHISQYRYDMLSHHFLSFMQNLNLITTGLTLQSLSKFRGKMSLPFTMLRHITT